MKVREILTADVVTCPPEADLTVAARKMFEGRFGALPVVDARGALVGIITDRDICLQVALSRRRPSQVAVHEVMTRSVRTCTPDADVRDALAVMQQARVRRLPVVDTTGRLVGIVSVDDILLRAHGQETAPSSEEIAAALRGICAPREEIELPTA